MSRNGYQSRRDFRRTPEPAGDRKRSEGLPAFVVQEHKASTHHFDFRLEVDGVLRSWAVPKGPSTDPREKRLAMQVEDHPIDYVDFEGTIPQDQYGEGTVIVWDCGPYDNITEKDGRLQPAADALAHGHLLVRLHGTKLRGGYALQRTGDRQSRRWLLIKMRDDETDARRRPVSTQPRSVLSGRTIQEIERESER